MTLYEIIFNWFSGSIFNSTDLESITYEVGQSTLTMNEWLNHTATILTLVLLVVCCGLFIRWIFKVVSGAILLK